MPSRPRSTDPQEHMPRFTVRGVLTAYSVIGVILSIPLVGLGFTVTGAILIVICLLQLPLFLLFGAFGLGSDALKCDVQASADLPEWDRWRNERDKAK